jgi:hypothetical protein
MEDEYEYEIGGPYRNELDLTPEQAIAEKETRMKLFPGTKYDEYNLPQYEWVKEKASSQTIETLEGVSEGLLYMESDTTVCAQFMDAFEPKKRESYGSFEAMFQESLLDTDLAQQFVNLQGTNPSIIHTAEPASKTI